MSFLKRFRGAALEKNHVLIKLNSLFQLEFLQEIWLLKKPHIKTRHVHNILRLFDGWANFLFATSETKHDY